MTDKPEIEQKQKTTTGVLSISVFFIDNLIMSELLTQNLIMKHQMYLFRHWIV